MTSIAAPVPTERLTSEARGRVITPDDHDYDAARAVASGEFDRRPAAIVRVVDAADVAAVIGVARETGGELAVRSGGHSMAGHGTTDGGIVIDLREMKRLEIDLMSRTAWAEAGLTAAEYSTAAAEHGLATGFGDTGSVGIGGLTLGGGIGYLVRRHGLTIDSLIGVEVVTADGRLLHVDERSHPDLFWAIRGGGGNFGVVTRFRFALHEVATVVGGMLVLPATAETVAGFVAAADAAPEELTTIANVMNCPPMPMIPAEHHGKVVIIAMLVWCGDVAAGQGAVAPFRALAEPIADLVKPMPYPEIYVEPDYGGAEDPGGELVAHPIAVARTMFVDTIDRAASAAVVDRLNASEASMRVAQIRVLGGAMARVPADATAFAHRSSRILVNVAAFYEEPTQRGDREAWVADLVDATRQRDDGAYVNFVGIEGPDRVRAAYPGRTFERLAAIKARYDPGNLFRLNQNIPPAAGVGEVTV